MSVLLFAVSSMRRTEPGAQDALSPAGETAYTDSRSGPAVDSAAASGMAQSNWRNRKENGLRNETRERAKGLAVAGCSAKVETESPKGRCSKNCQCGSRTWESC
jgi:hypothetical protein